MCNRLAGMYCNKWQNNSSACRHSLRHDKNAWTQKRMQTDTFCSCWSSPCWTNRALKVRAPSSARAVFARCKTSAMEIGGITVLYNSCGPDKTSRIAGKCKFLVAFTYVSPPPWLGGASLDSPPPTVAVGGARNNKIMAVFRGTNIYIYI